MLFWVFGSTAAGKTTLVAALRGRVPGLEVHDFNDVDGNVASRLPLA